MFIRVCSIRVFLQRDWHVTLRHVYRETNSTDFLVNFAMTLPLDFHLFSIPPIGARSFITHDMYVVIYPCLIVC